MFLRTFPFRILEHSIRVVPLDTYFHLFTGNGCSAQRVLLGRSMPGLQIVLLELVHVLDLDVADVRKLVVGMQP